MNCPQYGQFEIVYSWLDKFGTRVLSSLRGNSVSSTFCLLGILLALVYDVIQLSLMTFISNAGACTLGLGGDAVEFFSGMDGHKSN